MFEIGDLVQVIAIPEWEGMVVQVFYDKDGEHDIKVYFDDRDEGYGKGSAWYHPEDLRPSWELKQARLI